LLAAGRIFDAAALGAAARLDAPSSFATARGVLDAGPLIWEQLGRAAEDAAARGEGSPLSGVELKPPVPDPGKIICLGLNYLEHAHEAGLAIPETPMIFAKFKTSLTGPRSPIVLPARSAAVDYEAELAVVVGRKAKDVPAAEALSYVAGVMAFNDVTARDIQFATSQWTAGKAIDTFGPCGPALVFLDEIDDIQALGVHTRLNGESVQSGTTADMIFSVAATIEFLSSLMTLLPGDIIATGTPAGIGFTREPQIFLQPGDLLETEIDGVGTLRNPIVAARQSSTRGLPEQQSAASALVPAAPRS
jgi:2-keto-4-pentenoate hydratase/2-oxohepta-3-ene-1,7-dioic acid hydratase in catechol pathway